MGRQQGQRYWNPKREIERGEGLSSPPLNHIFMQISSSLKLAHLSAIHASMQGSTRAKKFNVSGSGAVDTGVI